MNSKLFVLFALAATIFGCDGGGFGPGMYDFRYAVAGNYELCRTSGDEIKVVPFDGWSDSTPRIPPKVVEIALDRTFVLAKQQHLRRRSPDDPRDTYEEPVPGEFSYWILDTSVPKAFGPFELEEFNKRRAKMKISGDLKLRDVYDFKR